MITRDEHDITGRFVIELEPEDAAFILRDVLDRYFSATGRPDGLVEDLRKRLADWLAAVEEDDDTYSEFDAVIGIGDQGESPEGSHHAP